jgi:hypothetical protein
MVCPGINCSMHRVAAKSSFGRILSLMDAVLCCVGLYMESLRMDIFFIFIFHKSVDHIIYFNFSCGDIGCYISVTAFLIYVQC